VTGADTSDPDPARDAQQILVRETRGSHAMSQLRTNHVKAWDALWQSDFTIVPKLGIPPEENARIQKIKRRR